MTENRYGLNSGYLSPGGLTVTVNPQVIGRSMRTATGALVQDLVATKRSWKFTYTDLPDTTGNVKNGNFGRTALLALYNAGGAQTLKVPVEGSTAETVSVLFGGTFTQKRTSILPFWRFDVEFTLEEI
jgi:hypothetical protein